MSGWTLGDSEPESEESQHLVVMTEAQEATTAGIYGIIISAAVMAAAHQPTVPATVVAVLGTLIIYWAAERYARIVAERIHAGHRPRWDSLREQLTSGWEMVTASLFPLLVLLIAYWFGADQRTSILWGLSCSTLLLCVAGWRVGRHGRLTRGEQMVSSAIAGVFGLTMIALKSFLH
ncbi:hypothetical protein [Krasilnikovia sp. MM14-A1259]|uniref:hypothetical protein n=1 Tax=Krasilnikovia sp. MM14-A1259 TaxID=3373539 RepID=UPI0038022027